jgi:hypothetical protein
MQLHSLNRYVFFFTDKYRVKRGGDCGELDHRWDRRGHEGDII